MDDDPVPEKLVDSESLETRRKSSEVSVNSNRQESAPNSENVQKPADKHTPVKHHEPPARSPLIETATELTSEQDSRKKPVPYAEDVRDALAREREKIRKRNAKLKEQRRLNRKKSTPVQIIETDEDKVSWNSSTPKNSKEKAKRSHKKSKEQSPLG